MATNTGNNAAYQSDTGNISDVYSTQITPAGWAFSIWGVIYTWQALWLLYAWTFVFREICISNYPRPHLHSDVFVLCRLLHPQHHLDCAMGQLVHCGRSPLHHNHPHYTVSFGICISMEDVQGDC